MSDQPSMDEIIAQQKEQCIFCKIIKGEIPTIKVYEDDLVIAIMDINPATKGHVLIMPKEHYPIMPLIPRPAFEHLFKITKYISRAVKEGVPSTRTSIFIANGAVAGQQSAHFMMHILPRDDSDSLSNLDCIGNFEGDFKELMEKVSPHFKSVIHHYGNEHESIAKFLLTESPATIQSQTEQPETSGPVATEDQKKKISELYNDNEEFKDLILNRLDELKDLIATSEKWGILFQGIDVDALSQKLKQLEENNG